MRNHARLIAVLTFFLFNLAQAEGLYLTGGEIARNASYLYVGHIGSLKHDKLQAGPAYRVWADQAKYQYSSNGVTHKATARSIEAGLGSLFQGNPMSGSGFISLVGRNTVISPDDWASDARGGAITAKIQGDLVYAISNYYSSNLSASYVALNNSYWARLRVMRALPSSRSAGIEIIHQGDSSYSLSQIGGVISALKLGSVDMTLKAGARKVRGESTSPYAGVELGANF